jgi:hypothetical protein
MVIFRLWYSNSQLQSVFWQSTKTIPLYTKLKDMKMQERLICKECNEGIDTKYTNGESLRKQRLCFSCDFWYSKIKIKDESHVVRVGGTHYMISSDNPPQSSYRGFGGARYDIRFHDGREVSTTNLWCQGGIPARFKERLPDNAIFEED